MRSSLGRAPVCVGLSRGANAHVLQVTPPPSDKSGRGSLLPWDHVPFAGARMNPKLKQRNLT